ncbi:hypothetical protein GQ44DRAFT_111345 [Phaeosphaeriaceae sp. PMI808]|nr:hypothetical protein GQ44DRAFT_111345 [Phaeosphaeriaceae sp. PMI808]
MDQIHAWVDTVPSFPENFEELTSHDSPRPHLKRTHHSPNSPRRVRPRLDPSTQSSAHNSFEMDSTTDASSITSLDSRRKLKATSPLMKRKGSQSPERTQRVLLEQGKPPIRIRQPDGTSQIVSSQELQGILSENFSDDFVPTYFKVRCYGVFLLLPRAKS